MPSELEIPGLKFWTRRNPERPSRGPRQARFAEIWFGRKFMPHQQLIADVAGELQPNGLPYYPLVVTTLQRRGGKTDLDLATTAERCFSVPKFKAWYCAQTGKDSRDAFLKFTDETLLETPLAKVVKTRRGNGHEDMTFPNSSVLKPHPPTEESLHGKDSDRNSVDEAWAHSEDEGKLLMQAIAPTQLTRPGAQTWVWSAGGTAASTWLAGLVARGRAGATAVEDQDGNPVRMAYFELGVPEGFDVNDIEGVAHYHPAFGHTINLEAFFNLREQIPDDAEWARAAGNVWTEVIGGVITADQWESLQHHDPVGDAPFVGYGAARSDDGSQVAIVAAFQVDDDLVVLEVCDILPSSRGAAKAVNGWADDGPVAVYPGGASSKLRNDLEDLGRDQAGMTVSDATAACATIDDGIAPRTVRFRPHPSLDAARLVAGKRRVQSGGWVWAVTAPGAPIAVLEAATAALHALRPKHRPAKEEQPAIHFGRSAA